jgi:hypothetical protein
MEQLTFFESYVNYILLYNFTRTSHSFPLETTVLSLIWGSYGGHHSPPTSAVVKKTWICTSTPPFAFMARDFTFPGVTMKRTVVWAAMPCNSEIVRRFGGTYRIHLHGRKIRYGRNQQKQAANWNLPGCDIVKSGRYQCTRGRCYLLQASGRRHPTPQKRW